MTLPYTDKFQEWNLGSAADGTNFDTEFDRLYENDAYLEQSRIDLQNVHDFAIDAVQQNLDAAVASLTASINAVNDDMLANRAFVVSGNDAIFTRSGNLGIGTPIPPATPAPQNKLQVVGDLRVSKDLANFHSSAASQSAKFGPATGQSNAFIGIHANDTKTTGIQVNAVDGLTSIISGLGPVAYIPESGGLWTHYLRDILTGHYMLGTLQTGTNMIARPYTALNTAAVVLTPGSLPYIPYFMEILSIKIKPVIADTKVSLAWRYYGLFSQLGIVFVDLDTGLDVYVDLEMTYRSSQ